MNTEFRLVESHGTDLSSRDRAATLRERILEVADTIKSSVLIDLNGVRTISDSFADELFAVIISERSEEWFRDFIQIANASREVRLSILEAIDERCSAGHE